MQASDTQSARPLADPRASAMASVGGIVRARLAPRIVRISRDDALLGATDEVLERGMGPRSDKGDGDPNQDPDPPMA